MSRKILLIFFFFGILFLIPFLKPPTSLAACDADWNLIGTDDRDWSVIYHLRLSDNCAGSNNYDIRVTNRTTNRPVRAGGNEILHFNWEYGNAGNNNPVTVSVNDSRNIDITVKRVRTIFHPNGWYDYVNVRASNSEASSTIGLRYRVENKPDLEVVPQFSFAGGCIGTRSQSISLNITNTGWLAVPSKANGGGFWVRVSNGDGEYEDIEITQRIDRNEVLRLGDRFENKINIPSPAGTYTARATIDSRGDVLEEDNFSEGNNKATDTYQSQNCAPATYSITGTVFLDTNGDTTPEGRYTGTGTLTTSPGGRTAQPSTTNGTFTITNNPNGSYNVTLSGLPAGYSIVTGGGYSNPRSVTVNNANTGGVNFLVRRIAPPPPPSADQWVQSVGGDIREDHGMAFTSNIIPGSTNFFSQNSSSPVMTHGVVFLKTPFNLGSDPQNIKANSNGWLIQNTEYMPNPIRSSYSQTLRNLTRNGSYSSAPELFGGSSSPCGGTGPNCNLRTNLQPGVYKTDAIDRNVNLSVTGPNYTFSSGNYIFIIKSDLNIDTDIIVPLGSTAIFIVGGDINVSSSVTRMDGIYSTDNDFSIDSDTPAVDERLIINGNVIANAGLKHKIGQFPGTLKGGRDLGVGNDTTPGVQVKMRPDFILNMPAFIRATNFNRQEVAPGE